MGRDTVDLLNETGPGFGTGRIKVGKAAVICRHGDLYMFPGIVLKVANQTDDHTHAPQS
jgi:hypothetical protein